MSAATLHPNPTYSSSSSAVLHHHLHLVVDSNKHPDPECVVMHARAFSETCSAHSQRVRSTGGGAGGAGLLDAAAAVEMLGDAEMLIRAHAQTRS